MTFEELAEEADRARLSLMKIKLLARRSMNESWCGHPGVEHIICMHDKRTWVAACAKCFTSDEDYSYYVKASDFYTTYGTNDTLTHMSEKPWFEAGFESFLNAAAFARCDGGKIAASPYEEGLSV